ncbi:MAG: pectin acetylesterase-family hydrolase [Polyangiales bacterium]
MKWSRCSALLLALALGACDEGTLSTTNTGTGGSGSAATGADGGAVQTGTGATGTGATGTGSTGNGSTGSGSTATGSTGTTSGNPYQEVFDQGAIKYAGTPMVQPTSVTSSALFPNIDVHHFSSDNRGPVCMYGKEYFVETREGSSDTLMIFMQGGGVCLNEICAATPAPILSLRLFTASSTFGIGGILDKRVTDNPTRDFDVVNAPYCDGSLFAGDVDRILPDGNALNGANDQAYQRGLANLTAVLETAKRTFPNPPRIVLVGSSGGAYGVIAGVVLTRHYYPNVPLLVVSDSGAPIVNGEDPGFIASALTQINAMDLIPKSCPDCISNGHATGIIAWALRRDPLLTVAYMTHARDHVIGEFFMGTTADQFQSAVVGESDRLLAEFPGRVFRFVIPSARHTLAMGMDNIPDGLQGSFLGLAGGLGVGFVGPDVNSKELSTWALGGMRETGTDASGTSWDGYAWLSQLIHDPAHTPSVLNLQ